LADAALNQDIHVIVEDDNDAVQTLPDGSIAIDSEDGGVVIKLNPQNEDAVKDANDPAKFYANVADAIDAGLLAVISNELFEAVSADDMSRSEWLANRAAGMALLGLKMEDPRSGDGNAAIDGQSVVTNPLLLDAILKGWANAQAELLPAEGPCKVVNFADRAVEGQDELGEAFQRDMNYFLTSIATEYAPETSHMLLWGCYFGGSGFKKVYTHPLKNRPASEAVSPEHLIVSDATKDLASCERITHVITMRTSVMKRYQAKNIYRDVVLQPPNPSNDAVSEEIAATQGIAPNKSRPEDTPYTLWEIQCELDLEQFTPTQFKGKGVPLPYLVTMDKDSREILSVRRDWKPEDEDCNRKKMYVKYPYVPGPGFYGTGLLNILGNSTSAMTAAWRISLDAGMYANFPSFLTDKLGGRQMSSDFRLSPGTGQQIETNNRPISDVVMALPYKDVTAGFMALIDKITQQAKDVGGSPDIPVGEGMQNIPVGTMIAHIEQATKVMAAAHKGQHTAQDEELQLIADLFRENPESFWKGNKNAQGYWTTQNLIEALETKTLVPKSDPNVPSHIHRVMKAVALVELLNGPLGPLLEKEEVLRRVLTAMREDINGLLKKPDPNAPPSPEMIEAQAKAKEADNKAKKIEVDAAVAAQKPGLEQLKIDGSNKGKTIDLAKTLIAHGGEREDAEHQRAKDTADHARNLNKDAAEIGQMSHEALMNEEKLKLEHRQTDLAENQHAHQRGVDSGKLGLEGQKIGISQQQADTQTHSALNPPKPAGAAKKKPKKK